MLINTKRGLIAVLLSSAATIMPLPASAQQVGISAEYNKALAIAQEHKQRDRGWQDAQSDMTMIIRSTNGRAQTREVAVRALEVLDDGDKSLMVFNQPKDVSGTAFLTFSHIDKPDDQWIYLPALKRIKRIASNNKSGAFMGSEFSYEDLSSFEVEKYDFRYIGTAALQEQPCHVIEMVPRDPHSAYSRTVAWLDRDALRFQQIEFYDRKDSLLKVLKIYDYQLIGERFWRAERSVMENRQTGKATEMLTRNIQLATGLSEDDFSQNNLKRAR